MARHHPTIPCLRVKSWKEMRAAVQIHSRDPKAHTKRYQMVFVLRDAKRNPLRQDKKHTHSVSQESRKDLEFSSYKCQWPISNFISVCYRF